MTAHQLEFHYHGNDYHGMLCGHLPRKRGAPKPLYFMCMMRSKAVVTPASSGSAQAQGVLLHAGTSACPKLMRANAERIRWVDTPAGAAARAWTVEQLLELHACTRVETSKWSELAAVVQETAPEEAPVPDTFRDAVLEAHEALERVPERRRGWQAEDATLAYMKLLRHASIRADAPPGARSELDDLYGDIMAGLHPAGLEQDHGRRLLLLTADKSDANEIGKFAELLEQRPAGASERQRQELAQVQARRIETGERSPREDELLALLPDGPADKIEQFGMMLRALDILPRGSGD